MRWAAGMARFYTNSLQNYDWKFTCAPYSVLTMIDKLIRWIGAFLRERQTYGELRRLDDRMLRDIGLHRSELGPLFGQLRNLN
jgi:uncharacterized protein YjiS (DUF1127 family)